MTFSNRTLAILSVVAIGIIVVSSFGVAEPNQKNDQGFTPAGTSGISLPKNYSFYKYNPSAAVKYGYMVHNNYFHTKTYPSGINASILQKNLDYFSNSEDCSHFVSQALIAGGLTILAQNPPGDNLQGYDGGQFVGSYGIVGVYRLDSYLAGYVLPIFSTNATAESTLGYQPIPASFNGSPLASFYYVTNDSMMPSYYLSPGDVISDGGVGGGHIMLYIGNGEVVQTDPAAIWNYIPGPLGGDYNISFYGLDTLNGKNVSSLYIHMPTFSSTHSVRITVLYHGMQLKDSTLTSNTLIPSGSPVYLIGSFPDGVGIGNYSYSWYDNGHLISTQQNFTFSPVQGANNLKLESTGSNGTATTTFTFYSGSVPITGYIFYIAITAVVLIAVGSSAFVFMRKMRKK